MSVGLRQWLWLFLLAVTAVSVLGKADEAASRFDAANKLYEQGQYLEAAAQYRQLAEAGGSAPVVLYNLGNAYYKGGQVGRAVASYRLAQRLAPRDPNVRFNLQFVRDKINAGELPAARGWNRWIGRLTVNEWTLLAMAASWVTFILLALGEVRPALKNSLRAYIVGGAATALVLGICAGTSYRELNESDEGVVVVPEAIVRYGPLDESQVYYQLRDGAELEVIDRKIVPGKTGNNTWLQVRDAARRIGWVKSDQLVILDFKNLNLKLS